jgi:UDP-N-acetylmuramate: L-alanyl-gamma-D-glutamyl-meso-diaminopimelate ligase
VLFGPVNRAQLLEEADRLSPQAIAQSIRAQGRDAIPFRSAAEIAEHVADHVGPGDLVLIMSNGSFDDLTSRVLERLNARNGVHG